MVMDENDRRVRVPSHVTMAWPALCAIKMAGGSATNAEILEAVAHDLDLNEEQRSLKKGRGSRTVLEYRLAWSRTFLRNMDAITNDAPCQWSITERGREVTPSDIQQFAKKMLDKLQDYKRAREAN
jgi:restriction system protein